MVRFRTVAEMEGKRADSVVAAITQHNIVFQAALMGRARDAVLEDRFPDLYAYLSGRIGFYDNHLVP